MKVYALTLMVAAASLGHPSYRVREAAQIALANVNVSDPRATIDRAWFLAAIYKGTTDPEVRQRCEEAARKIERQRYRQMVHGCVVYVGVGKDRQPHWYEPGKPDLEPLLPSDSRYPK